MPAAIKTRLQVLLFLFIGSSWLFWLVIIGTAIIAYIQNSRTFVATRLLLAVVAIDTSRTPRVNEKRVGSFPGVPKMAVW